MMNKLSAARQAMVEQDDKFQKIADKAAAVKSKDITPQGIENALGFNFDDKYGDAFAIKVQTAFVEVGALGLKEHMGLNEGEWHYVHTQLILPAAKAFLADNFDSSRFYMNAFRDRFGLDHGEMALLMDEVVLPRLEASITALQALEPTSYQKGDAAYHLGAISNILQRAEGHKLLMCAFAVKEFISDFYEVEKNRLPAPTAAERSLINVLRSTSQHFRDLEQEKGPVRF